ncbi:redox-sensitive transcriptional activator SoxR [Stenotrophomonas sp. UBA7606]|uniref:redox-sensitive transcriptional activator SoxR n=1 Tax=Stenotrophomonas sp. UBA7606 TaxID=1947559 RepID=UPI0025ED6C0C|nr:redox-sensitive transcriptional activator SoxR [Stenotrophomonas sp. UBA7606]
MSTRELSVGEVARRSGIAVSALHFYERKGLIQSQRTAGNQRRYQSDVLRRLALVQAAQQVGIPLQVVAERLAELPAGRAPSRADWARMSARWRKELDERIATLQFMRDQLSDCIGCGCLSLKRCGLLNPQDVLGQQGEGPQRVA